MESRWAKILFTAIPFDQEAESNDIYVMDSDGTNMINLTQSAENEGFASLSPSGKEIVFDKFIGEENSAIYVMGRKRPKSPAIDV